MRRGGDGDLGACCMSTLHSGRDVRSAVLLQGGSRLGDRCRRLREERTGRRKAPLSVSEVAERRRRWQFVPNELRSVARRRGRGRR